MQGKDSIASRLAQAAAMQVQAKYSTGTCFVWSVRFVNSGDRDMPVTHCIWCHGTKKHQSGVLLSLLAHN